MEQQTQICLTVIVVNTFQQEVMLQPAVQSLVCTLVNFLSCLILFNLVPNQTLYIRLKEIFIF